MSDPKKSLSSLIVDRSSRAHQRLVREQGAAYLKSCLDAAGHCLVSGEALGDLPASGLEAQTIIDNELHSLAGLELGARLDLPAEGNYMPGEGLALPYRALDGSAQPDERGVGLVRVRLYGKSTNYRAPPAIVAGIYVPLAIRAALRERRTCSNLVITEGEKRALALTQEGLFTVAITGVTQWSCPLVRREEKLLGDDAPVAADIPLNPTLLAVIEALGVERVLVVADSDARGNRMVAQAMGKLTAALRKQTDVCAMLFIVPAVPDESGVRSKTGLDDWLVRVGRVGVLAQLQRAFESVPRRREVVGGFAPLGFRGMTSVIWSHARECILELSPADLNENALSSALGASWVLQHYGYAAENGSRRLDLAGLRQELLDACQLAGTYDERRIRGAGVWRAEDGVVVNAGDSVWHSDGSVMGRVVDGVVYPAGRRLGLEPGSSAATTTEVDEVLQTLREWHFLHPTDPVLLLGWLYAGTLAGALDWRPHLMLTASRGSGKTTLQALVNNLLGSSSLLIDGDSTAAGVRQRVARDAMAVIIDEFENAQDERGVHRVQSLIGLLRSASSASESSAGVVRGTADGHAVGFAIQITAMLAMVVPPRLNAADDSRFAVLRLGSLDEGCDKPALAADSARAQALGQRLRRLAIAMHQHFEPSLATLRKVMLTGRDSGRLIDTIGTLLVGAWLLCHRRAMSEGDARSWLLANPVQTHRSRVMDASDERECIEHILRFQAREFTESCGAGATIIELLVAAQKGDSEAGRLLQRYGLKLSQNAADLQVALSPNFEGIRKLFRESRYTGGSHAAVLRRIVGASECTPRFNGQSARALAIPMTFVQAEVQDPHESNVVPLRPAQRPLDLEPDRDGDAE